MDELLTQAAILVAPAYLITELVGRATRLNKDVAALFVGPICALIAYGVGWIGPYGDDIWGWAAAAVFGGVGGIAAGLVNDYGVKPFQKEK